jgi:hypothetical protein
MEYVPMPHNVHVLVPAPVPYVPALQLVHVLWPIPEYVPAVHVPLMATVPVQKLPIVQFLQSQLLTYWPAGQDNGHGFSGQLCLKPSLTQHVLHGPIGTPLVFESVNL